MLTLILTDISIHRILFLALKKFRFSKLLLLSFSPPGKRVPPSTKFQIPDCRLENPDLYCSCNPNSKLCLLCLNEKYEIATYKEDKLLKHLCKRI